MDGAAAGEADRERLVVGVAERDDAPLPRARRAPRATRVTTAPSTQPPDTEPATSPASFTAIVAPGSRGAEPSSATTRGDRDPVAVRPASARCRPGLPSCCARLPSDEVLSPDTTRARCSSDARLWPSTNSSTCGRAAAIPRASGAKPGDAFSGFTHTTWYATRCRRSICSPSTSGSPRSQPSERITTTAPRAMPAHAPLVVELAQPLAEPGAARPVGDPPGGGGDGGVGIARRQLPGDAGEPGADGERLDPAPARRRRRAGSAPGPRAYASIEPLTSHSSTRRRGRSAGSTKARLIGSPPARSARRTVRRRSGRPRLAPARRACGATAASRRPGAGRPSAGATRRTRRGCSARSRAGAAPRRGCSAPTSVGASLASAVVVRRRVVVAVVVEREHHLALGRRRQSAPRAPCSHHAAKPRS